jgi:hypothetical protein
MLLPLKGHHPASDTATVTSPLLFFLLPFSVFTPQIMDLAYTANVHSHGTFKHTCFSFHLLNFE